MSRLITAHDPDLWASLSDTLGVSALSAAEFAQSAPTEHLVVERNGALAGRCSLWTGSLPGLDGAPPAAIGHFEAIDAAAAAQVLESACAAARAAGRTRVVGPMDGNTWRRYRFVTETSTRAPFLLEPTNDAAYPGFWLDAGFEPLSRYLSTIHAVPTRSPFTDNPRLEHARERIEAAGIRTRQLDPSRFEDELRAIHTLSVNAFASNYLYTAIDADAFIDMYRPVRDHVVPDLVLLAERVGELVGYVFGIPDLLQAHTGRVDTLICKTVAVASAQRGLGLGAVLIHLIDEAARVKGFRHVIHALMHESNASTGYAPASAEVIRRYSLFQKRLA